MLGQALKFRKCARTYCIRTPLKCNKGVGKHFQRVPVECNTLPNHGCSWLAAALELGINLHWVEAKQSSLHARNIQWSFHPRE